MKALLLSRRWMLTARPTLRIVDGVVQSPHAPIDIPDGVSITQLVMSRARGFGDRVAAVEALSGRSISYAQLSSSVDRLAAALWHDVGVRRGDVVAIHSPNVLEYAVWFHALGRIGAVSTTSSPLFNAEELSEQLRDSGARFAFTVGPLADTVMRAASMTAGGLARRNVIVAGAAAGQCESLGATDYATLARSAALEREGGPPNVQIDPARDIATLPYSSGTTGRPKGVELTHRNLVANLLQLAAVEPAPSGETFLGLLPFYHIYAMLLVLNYSLWGGATVAVLPKFEPETLLKALQQHRVTRAHVAPPLLVFLAKHPLVAQYDLSSLRLLFSGAAPVGDQVEQAVRARLGCDVKQAYGMTEMSPASHVSPEGFVKPGSVGPLVPNTEAKIVCTHTGRVLGPNEPGELWVRGPQVMKGYLNRPDATSATLTHDGFLRTGDVAKFDEDGYFSILDRVKELIKYKGHQVAPAELEALLLRHHDIVDAAVVPSVDADGEEIPKAFVVRKPHSPVTEAAVMAFVAEHVAPYKRVRAVQFIEQVPKSPAGKILRRVLVAQDRAKHTK
jgi:acyl-CoA synthetase (AMP-forming)/AMP-acid ligase II